MRNMNEPNNVGGLLSRVLGNLRFPQLFVVTAVLFVADLAIPDVIPFVDEILLGLATLLLASLRKRKAERQNPPIDDHSNGPSAKP